MQALFTVKKPIKFYDGTTWIPSGGLSKSTSQPDPTDATDGDLWVDTASQQLYLFSHFLITFTINDLYNLIVESGYQKIRLWF